MLRDEYFGVEEPVPQDERLCGALMAHGCHKFLQVNVALFTCHMPILPPKPLFIPGNDYGSDIEEYFPERIGDSPGHQFRESQATLAEALSRAFSQAVRIAIVSLDDSEGGNKRPRWDSDSSHHSVTSNDETAHDSLSPHLRPATSSFQYDPAHPPIPPVSTCNPTSSSTPATGVTTSATGTISTSSASTSTSASTGSSPGSSPPVAIGSAPTAPGPAAASISSVLQTAQTRLSRSSTGATVKKWVPPPPRAGLKVPKPSNNPWRT
ncbi:hypothetical protein B0H14DRAFT_2628684 [Mycena olivaceomarginata]|nr:hypothetical protein B0H14DRAFT_2628684 [Mycena olivaceomarginata]